MRTSPPASRDDRHHNPPVNGAAARVLYLSYDGMTDPLGRSQVLPYLTRLSGRGHAITLVSLEKSDLFARHRETVERICGTAGIAWHPLPFRNRPPLLSGWFNVAALDRAADRIHRRCPFDIIHARSDLAGIAGLALQNRYQMPFLYDMRAFWPDERAEGGAWDQSKLLYRTIFRYFKARQLELLNAADQIVTLSEEGRCAVREMDAYQNSAPIAVIPCCADFDAFTLPKVEERDSHRAALNLTAGDRLVIHVGSIGCNVLLREMLDFFGLYRVRYPGAKLLFLTPDDDGTIIAAADQQGIAEQVYVRSATREDVPAWIGAADLGLFFVRPVFSKKAASPTKLGEMLAVGLPVVTNSGIGDVVAIIADVGAGVVVDRFDATAYDEAIDRLDALVIEPCDIREKALPWFDVNLGTDHYDAVYRRLASLAKSAPNKKTGVVKCVNHIS